MITVQGLGVITMISLAQFEQALNVVPGSSKRLEQGSSNDLAQVVQLDVEQVLLEQKSADSLGGNVTIKEEGRGSLRSENSTRQESFQNFHTWQEQQRSGLQIEYQNLTGRSYYIALEKKAEQDLELEILQLGEKGDGSYGKDVLEQFRQAGISLKKFRYA